MKKWDIIVVGAGNGGLAAAAYLAKANKNVLLLERHNIPGGFATSFKRGRFEFEASLHELSGFGNEPGQGPLRAMFDELAISDRIEWAHVPAAYRLIVKNDNIDASMPFGVDAYTEKMESYVPGSKPAIRKLFDLAGEISKTTGFLGELNGSYNFGAVTAILKEHMNFLRVAGYSVNDVLNALKVPKKAQDIFNAYSLYLGVDCSNLSFIHYMVMVLSYLQFGAVVPKGRSHEMSSAVLRRFEEFGGEARFNSHVEKIMLENGAVKGVKLLSGETLLSDHVVCNCSHHNVFGKMIEKSQVPEREIKAANARTFGASGFGLFLGLNRSPEELGIKDHCYLIYDTANTVKLMKSLSKIETNHVQATVCLNMADPDCSPEGTSILYFTSLFTDDAWGSVTEKDYFKTKQAFAKHLIEDFENATGISIQENIEEIEISTPMTYARYTDAPQGVIYGYSASLWDGIVPRIMMADMDEKIPGLRFAGGFGTQLGGYSSAYTSGRNAAHATLKDIEKAGAAK